MKKFLTRCFLFFKKYLKVKWHFTLKKNILKNDEKIFIKTVAIRSYNTTKKIKILLNIIKPNETIVLLFHSVTDDSNYLDVWVFSKDRFEKICLYIKEKNLIT